MKNIIIEFKNSMAIVNCRVNKTKETSRNLEYKNISRIYQNIYQCVNRNRNINKPKYVNRKYLR